MILAIQRGGGLKKIEITNRNKIKTNEITYKYAPCDKLVNLYKRYDDIIIITTAVLS